MTNFSSEISSNPQNRSILDEIEQGVILKHKHLIVRALIKKKNLKTPEVNEWMKNFIQNIGMQLLIGPYSAYENMKGNRGITSIVALTTSHASLHIWDETDPGLLEFDLYSCKEFSLEHVFDQLKFFDPVKIEYMFIDREHNLSVVDIGEK